MNDSNWKKLIDLGRLPLTGTILELTEIMQSMLYLNATARCFRGQCLVWQHLIR